MNAIERARLALMKPDDVDVPDLIKQLVETDAALARSERLAQVRLDALDELRAELREKDAELDRYRRAEQ